MYIWLTILEFLQCLKQFETEVLPTNSPDDHGTNTLIVIPTPEGAGYMSPGVNRTELVLSLIGIIIISVLVISLLKFCVAKFRIRYDKAYWQNQRVRIGGVAPEDGTYEDEEACGAENAEKSRDLEVNTLKKPMPSQSGLYSEYLCEEVTTI